MKNPFYILAALALPFLAAAQANTETKRDTVKSVQPAETRSETVVGGKTEAARRRSNSEIEAEKAAKSNNQTKANEKPNPNAVPPPALDERKPDSPPPQPVTR